MAGTTSIPNMARPDFGIEYFMRKRGFENPGLSKIKELIINKVSS